MLSGLIEMGNGTDTYVLGPTIFAGLGILTI